MLKAKKRLTKREIKEDKLVTAWFKSLDYANKHVREISIGAAIVAVIIAGVIWLDHQSSQKEQEAAVLFARAKAAYDAQLFDAARETLVELVNDYGGTMSAGIGTIYLANSFMQKQEYEVAEDYYRKYIDDYDDDPILSATAAAGIAATYEERKEYEKAGELYEDAAKDYESSYRAPELLMRAARCYKLANSSDATLRVINLLIEKYPDAEFADDAKLMKAEMQS